MKRFALVLLAALALSLDAPRPALGCGGPYYADLGVMGPVTATVQAMVTPDEYWATWGNAERPELRFLHPFVKERPKEIQPLWDFSHEGVTQSSGPSLGGFEQAIRDGDLQRAETEARAVVDAIYAMPPVPAASEGATLARAVDFLELRPRLAGKPRVDVQKWFVGAGADPSRLPKSLRSARKPSLDLEAIEADFRAKIPDGYSDVIQKSVKPAVFARFDQRLASWTKQHPQHVLADRARLFRVRVRYFAGDTEGAWQVLFDLYPRRLPRVLAEMRYLLVQGRPPSAQQLDALTDGPLVAALASQQRITASRFDKWWKLSGTAPRSAWSVSLQERLLLWAVTGTKGPLPATFPAQADNPTPLWGKLRLAALIRARRLSEARAQLRSLAPDAEQARLGAQYFLARGRADLAAQLPALDADSRSYLLRVMVSDRGLATTAKSKDAGIARAARFERAVRLVGKRKWKTAAALIARDDPARAKKWERVAELAARHDDLALARYLARHHGELLYDADTGFYRAASTRFDGLGNAPEAAAIRRSFERSSERWLALEAYVRWLDKHASDRSARDVLAEADGVYNLLVNWAGGDTFLWGRVAQSSPVVAKLRAVGRRIRQP